VQLNETHDPQRRSWVESANREGCEFPVQNLPFGVFRRKGAKGARIVTRAEGVYLWDSDGNKTLDAMSGLWCVNVGYGRKELAEAAYRQMLETATQLNTPGLKLADMEGVHALTDVTGFGLLGHLLEICRGSKLQARLDFDRVPILSAARHLVEAGYATGASDRNWASCREEVELPAEWPEWRRKILTDPQTSGGLLVACDAATAPAVLEVFRQEKFQHAARIGTFSSGAPRITVT